MRIAGLAYMFSESLTGALSPLRLNAIGGDSSWVVAPICDNDVVVCRFLCLAVFCASDDWRGRGRLGRAD